FTADPRVVKKARKIDWISFEDMLELASSGSKVLLHRCVEYARRYNIPIHVRSSFSGLPGTWVSSEPRGGGAGHRGQGTPGAQAALTGQGKYSERGEQGEQSMEQAIISGVAHDTSEAKVTVVGVPDKPGEAAGIFAALADAEINIDMIVQNVSGAAGRTDISFTLPKSDGAAAMAALEKVKNGIGFEGL